MIYLKIKIKIVIFKDNRILNFSDNLYKIFNLENNILEYRFMIKLTIFFFECILLYKIGDFL